VPVLVIGDDVGFTIGVEFGFGVGDVVTGVPFAVVGDVPLGLTIGLDVGFGFGLELGFGVGFVVTAVPVFADGFAVFAGDVVEAGFVELFDELPLAAAGLPKTFEELPLAAAGFPELFDEPPFAAAGLPDAPLVPTPLDEELPVPLLPLDPAPPPVDWAKDTVATEPISNAAMVFEREVFMSPPCQSRASQKMCVNR